MTERPYSISCCSSTNGSHKPRSHTLLVRLTQHALLHYQHNITGLSSHLVPLQIIIDREPLGFKLTVLIVLLRCEQKITNPSISM